MSKEILDKLTTLLEGKTFKEVNEFTQHVYDIDLIGYELDNDEAQDHPVIDWGIDEFSDYQHLFKDRAQEFLDALIFTLLDDIEDNGQCCINFKAELEDVKVRQTDFFKLNDYHQFYGDYTKYLKDQM